VKTGHDWFGIFIAAAGAVAVNAVMLAFSYGRMEARVEALESQREIEREEWKAARERIEKAFEKLDKK
jgi:outer membrane murein-binding lipoprotein Lpp